MPETRATTTALTQPQRVALRLLSEHDKVTKGWFAIRGHFKHPVAVNLVRLGLALRRDTWRDYGGGCYLLKITALGRAEIRRLDRDRTP